MATYNGMPGGLGAITPDAPPKTGQTWPRGSKSTAG